LHQCQMAVRAQPAGLLMQVQELAYRFPQGTLQGQHPQQPVYLLGILHFGRGNRGGLLPLTKVAGTRINSGVLPLLPLGARKGGRRTALGVVFPRNGNQRVLVCRRTCREAACCTLRHRSGRLRGGVLGSPYARFTVTSLHGIANKRIGELTDDYSSVE
jgi:hypothetical protein